MKLSIILLQLVRPQGAFNYTFPDNISLNRYTGLVTWNMRYEGEYFLMVRVFEYDFDNVMQGWADQAFVVVAEDPTLSKIAVVSPSLDSVTRVVLKSGQAL